MLIIDKEDKSKATKVEAGRFCDLELTERNHLQEWIEANPEILGEDLLIISKEFAGWEGTNERLDLLAIDKDGKLVIIENKRDDSGRDVVWQALKYASYCASLTKENIHNIYQKYLKGGVDSTAVASEEIAKFLEEDYEKINLNPELGQRIILVAANFPKEVTTTVLWLSKYNLNISCVKVTPYEHEGQIYVDSKVILPLQDVGDWQIKMNEKRMDEIVRKEQTTTRERRGKIKKEILYKYFIPAIRELGQKYNLTMTYNEEMDCLERYWGIWMEKKLLQDNDICICFQFDGIRLRNLICGFSISAGTRNEAKEIYIKENHLREHIMKKTKNGNNPPWWLCHEPLDWKYKDWEDLAHEESAAAVIAKCEEKIKWLLGLIEDFES